MNTDNELTDQHLTTDIVISGGGAAGLSAAIAAAELGAKVVLLEKRKILGGNANMAEGIFGAESPVQKRLWIEARRDVLFEMAMDFSHWKINPHIIRAFIDKSGDTIRWLEEMGIEFKIYAGYMNQAIPTWHSTPNKLGSDIVKGLKRRCDELGVKILKETPAKKILKDGKGNLTGILAETKKSEIKILAKCIIIATGGYAGNKELLNKYCPVFENDIDCHGIKHMGDGILMALESGAASEGLGILQSFGPAMTGSMEVGASVTEPNTIWVNKRGERFTDEALTTRYNVFESVNPLLRQPEKKSFTIFDEKIKSNIIEKGFIFGYGLFMQPHISKPDFEKKLQKEIERGKVKRSNSLNEIAEWIGASPGVLKKTVEEYNRFCEKGYDEHFVKDPRYLIKLDTPPYYTIKCGVGMLTTIGGIKINQSMEVLDQNDNPIPGLYAAGVDTGGWEEETYNVRLSGSSFGFAINSGRIAAENASKYFT
jgi:fumarate reductase flavoprotein subunit